jgi:methylthioribose-1-phosphate isomerase
MSGDILSVCWVGGDDGFLRLLDQTRLPGEIVYRDCRDAASVRQAIKDLLVRGAPAIGVAAAYGLALEAFRALRVAPDRVLQVVIEQAELLRDARPTAVNLGWACDRMVRLAKTHDPSAAATTLGADLLREAHAIRDEDAAMCRAMGRHGAALLRRYGSVLTHCNTGGLATAEYGTALGVIRAARDDGADLHVYVDETRPLFQGARLTAWELARLSIPHTLICDNMAGWLMRCGKVAAVIVGADRIAANGDAANKIGTYSLAVLARHHGIPFFVAAPSSTFDLAIRDGSRIPIEERSAGEVAEPCGRRIAPLETPVFNPAFDVTPAELISAIITERGVIRPVCRDSVAGVVAGDGTKAQNVQINSESNRLRRNPAQEH